MTPSFSTGKGSLSRSAQLSVPLVIAKHPDLTPGSRSKALTGNLDIPATVLDIAGASEGIGLSRSLFDMLGPEPEQARAVNFSEVGDSIKIVEEDGYRGTGRIAVPVNVPRHAIRTQAEPFANGIVDTEVCLVRDEPIDVVQADASQ